MKHFKFAVTIFTLLFVLSAVTACNGDSQPPVAPAEQAESVPAPEPAPPPEPIQQEEPTPEAIDEFTGTQVNIGVLRGPSGMGLAQLMAVAEDGLTLNEYNFTLGGAPEEMTAGIISGALDIANVPANVASVLYNVTEGGVQLIAINTLGVLFVLDSTGDIETIHDLQGRTVNITGQGATPHFVFEHILRENGILDDVEIIFNTEHTELASLMIAGNVEIGLLPQPFVTNVTLQSEDIDIALDLAAEWAAVNPGSVFVQGVVVARTEFVEQNPEAIASFLQDQAESVAFVNANPDEASELMGRFDIIPPPVALQAIPRSNLVSISGAEAKPLVESFLQVIYEANPQAVGGSLPDENFFFIGE